MMANADDKKKTCFVVMGFGDKTDFQSVPPRVLDLNRTYEDIIQPAVMESGFECIRADMIIHSGLIDGPIFEHLLDADVVIADLLLPTPTPFTSLACAKHYVPTAP